MEEFISKCSSLPGSNMLMNSWAYLPKSGLHRNWRNVVDPIVTSQWCQCSIPGFRCCWHWEGFMAFAFAMMNDKPYESHVFMVTGGSPLALGHWPSDFHRNLKRTPLDFTTWIGKKSQRFFSAKYVLAKSQQIIEIVVESSQFCIFAGQIQPEIAGHAAERRRECRKSEGSSLCLAQTPGLADIFWYLAGAGVEMVVVFL